MLVQGSWVDWPDGVYDRVGNILLSRVLGAQLDFSKEDFSIAIKQSWEQALDRVRRAGGKPYAIPAGASDHPLGGLGYVGFAEELREQERDARLPLRFHPRSPRARAARRPAMVVGFAADGRADRVIGIDITAKPQETRAQVKRIAERTADLVGLGRAVTDADIVLDERYAYPAYGVPAAATLDAIRLGARLEGMLTDPVYERKSMQAMIDMVRSGAFPAGSKLLYVHLGGVPALSAYSYPLREG